jgi:stress-induced morphogen
MTSEQALRLVDALKQRFGGDVDLHQDEGESNGRYHFSVVSPKFEQMSHLQRQDAIWATVDEVLSREDGLDVAMVWAFAPGEMEEWLKGLAK